MNLKTGSIKGHLITSQHDIHSGVCVCVRPGNTHTHRRVINDLLTCCIDDDVTTPPPAPPKSPSHRGKRQQQEMLSELRRRQGKDSRHVYEGKDGAIEDIITGTHTAVTHIAVTHTAGTHITHLSPLPISSAPCLPPSALKTVPFTARSAKRSSRFFCDPAHSDDHY